MIEVNIELTQDNLRLENLEANQATHILADHVFRFITVDEVLAYIKIWISRLRKGGLLHINDIDFIRIANNAICKNTTIPETNRILYNNRKSCLTLEDISDILKNLGLKIEEKRFCGIEYSITARRI